MLNYWTAQPGTAHPAQDFSFIGSRLIQLDALLDAIRVVANPAVAADGLDADKIEELIDVAKYLLREADTAFCEWHERVSKNMGAAAPGPPDAHTDPTLALAASSPAGKPEIVRSRPVHHADTMQASRPRSPGAPRSSIST